MIHVSKGLDMHYPRSASLAQEKWKHLLGWLNMGARNGGMVSLGWQLGYSKSRRGIGIIPKLNLLVLGRGKLGYVQGFPFIDN